MASDQSTSPTIQLSNAQTFSKLFQDTHITVYRYVFGLSGGPREEVDDIVAEAYTRAWDARLSFHGDADSVLRWLFTIARNVFIDGYRRRETLVDIDFLDERETPTAPQNAEDRVITIEKRRILWRLLQTLPEEPREILVLRYLLDWQVKDIARYVDKNETAVSMAIHRALKRLQERWPNPKSMAEK